MVLENNRVLGIFKITENGLCSYFEEFKEAKKNYDPQLIAGFLYTLSNFTSDFIGEDIEEIDTKDYRILFKKYNKECLVYIVDKDFIDYSILKPECIEDLNQIIITIST